MFEKIDFSTMTKLNILNTAFQAVGFDLRLVGGAVRDLLLDKIPHDFDLCTNATPDEMIAIAAASSLRVVPTGIKHGTVTFVVVNESFEITTLRIDQNCDGRHADVAFTRSFEEDAARRDFTINAMSMSFDGVVHDFFNGKEDLKNRVVRFVGNPADRIREDFLRVFRFFRFMNKFDDATLDSEAFSVITQKWVKDGILTISVERVWSELKNMLGSKNAFKQFQMMHDAGILEGIGIKFLPHGMWFRTATSCDVSPMAKMSTLTTVENVVPFGRRMKMSVEEIAEMEFVRRNLESGVINLKHLLANGANRKWVLDTADIFGVLDVLEGFNPPEFPVSGKDLIARGVQPGPEMGNILRKMRKAWTEKVVFGKEMTREQLLTMVKV